jgi:hypothetical protein
VKLLLFPEVVIVDESLGEERFERVLEKKIQKGACLVSNSITSKSCDSKLVFKIKQ